MPTPRPTTHVTTHARGCLVVQTSTRSTSQSASLGESLKIFAPSVTSLCAAHSTLTWAKTSVPRSLIAPCVRDTFVLKLSFESTCVPLWWNSFLCELSMRLKWIENWTFKLQVMEVLRTNLFSLFSVPWHYNCTSQRYGTFGCPYLLDICFIILYPKMFFDHWHPQIHLKAFHDIHGFGFIETVKKAL